MSQAEPLRSEVDEMVAHKVRHAVGVQALRKIGKIVAGEQQVTPSAEDFFANHAPTKNAASTEIIEHKVRDAVAVNALHKIASIVAEEQQAEAEKAQVLRWLMRYGWLAVIAMAALLAKLTGVL